MAHGLVSLGWVVRWSWGLGQGVRWSMAWVSGQRCQVVLGPWGSVRDQMIHGPGGHDQTSSAR